MRRTRKLLEKLPFGRRLVFVLSLSLSLISFPVSEVSASQPVDSLVAAPNISLVAAVQSNCGGGWALDWIVCPILEGFSNFIDWIMGFVADSLEWEISPKLLGVWTSFLPIANVAFAIVFMIVIYSTATGIGLTNYSIKKILPRLVVIAVAINVSYYICAALADLSNIVGANLGYLFPDGEDYNFGDGVTDAFAKIGSTIAVVLLLVFCGGAMGLAAITILLALTARYAALYLLVAISPLAAVCALLPQTEKWAQKWLKTYVQLLVAYPIFMLAWHGVRWIQFTHVLYDTGNIADNVAGWLVSLLLPIAPLFVIMPALKFGGGLMSKMAGGIEKGINNSPIAKNIKERDEVRPQRLINAYQNRVSDIPETFQKGDDRLQIKTANDFNSHAAEEGFLRKALGLGNDDKIDFNDAAQMTGLYNRIDAKDSANGNNNLRDKLTRQQAQDRAGAQEAADEHNTKADEYNDELKNVYGSNLDNYNNALESRRRRGRKNLGWLYAATGQTFAREKQQIETGGKRNFDKYSAEEMEKSRQNPAEAARLASRMGGRDRYLEQMGMARAQLEDESKKAVEGIKMMIQNDLDLKLAKDPQMDKVAYLIGRFQQTNDSKERAGILETLRGQGGPGSVAIGQMMELVHSGNNKAQMAELDSRVAQMSDVEARNPLAVEAAKRGITERDIIEGSANITVKERMDILNGMKVGTVATMQTKYVKAIKDKFAVSSTADPAEQTAMEAFFDRYRAQIQRNPGAKASMKGDQLEVWGIT
jgi:hypothetical protein